MAPHELYVHQIDGTLIDVTTTAGPHRSVVGRSRVRASNNEVDVAFDSNERWKYGEVVLVTIDRGEA